MGMRFSIAVIISLVLFRRVLFSRGSFLVAEILSDEGNLLGKFFAETNLFLTEVDTRHVTVVGKSDHQLHQAKPLLEAFPHFVGRDAEEFCASGEFAPDTVILYFLASLEKKYLSKVGTILSSCKRNRLYLIFEGTLLLDEVDFEWLLRDSFKWFNKLPVFIHHVEKSLKLYGYKMTVNCSGEVDLLVDWKPGFDTKRLEDWRDNFSLEGCPLPIGTMHHPPWMNLAEEANGTVKITGGSEGNILLAIAEKMKFTPLVQDFRPRKVKNETEEPIVASCASGKTSIGIAQMSPKKGFVQSVDMSSSYAEECIIWAIPKIHHWSRDIVTSEFSSSGWLLIGIIFFASFGLETIVRSTPYLNTANANDAKCSNIILDLIGSTLGNPIVYEPVSKGSKFLLLIYICYSTVITTAYKTSLSSMLTVDNGDSQTVSAEEIIRLNITPGGSMFKLSILEDQIEEDESTPELIKRYVIETNISKAIRRVSRDKNFAYLTSFSDVVYHTRLQAKSGEQISVDTPDRCVLTFRIVMVFPKSSHLTDRINHITLDLFASGLVKYWTETNPVWNRMDYSSLKSYNLNDIQEWLHSFTRDKFFYIFYIYSLALTLCVTVFLAEIFIRNLKNRPQAEIRNY